jgi:hypothetical protein
MRVFILTAGLIVASLPALAQERQPACAHGASQMAVAGADLDTLRCRLQVSAEMVANLQEQAIVQESARRMLESDLAAERKAKADTDAYWSAYIGK